MGFLEFGVLCFCYFFVEEFGHRVRVIWAKQDLQENTILSPSIRHGFRH